MSNGSPSQDEIERQNRCLRACGDVFDAIEQVWERLFEDKKITAERTLLEFKKCSNVHHQCCDECVPRQRRASDEQKDLCDTLGNEFLGIASVGTIAAVGAEAIFKAPAVGVVIIIFSAGALAFCVGYTLRWAIDPIDPNFSKLPIPSFPKLPTVRSDTRLPASVAKAANAVLANQAQGIGLLNALLTALDRSDSAADAGDTSAEERQLKAARDFAKELADVHKDAMPLRSTLASLWTGPDLDFTILEQDALKLRDDLIINGFPRQFLDALKKLGVDQKDQESLRQRLIIRLASLSGFHQIRFRDLLTDRGLRAAEIGAISALEQFSRSQ
jgi:hypothetical protein